MNRKLIYHIYWGTAGNAGLYLDEIYQALNDAGYHQKAFVSYYYPFDYGDKIFFMRTELEHCKYKGLVRKLLQAVELLYALIKIVYAAKKDKPEIVNYSYVSRGNKVLLWFLRTIKINSNCLVITCHDVIPIIKDENEYNKEIEIKKKIYSLADYYLIHTDSSANDLKKMFKVIDSQILYHPFPLMDLSKISVSNKKKEQEYDFLFIGHMRPEKGVNILFDAWKSFHRIYPQAKLCLAGNPNYFAFFLEEHRKECDAWNIDLVLGFIKDEDYIRIVNSTKCVVFPYTGGTNSGVISTVVSLGKDVITSDIGMFTDSPFVPRNNMFKSGNSNSLVTKMTEFMEGRLKSDNISLVEAYRKAFSEQVITTYAKIISTI